MCIVIARLYTPYTTVFVLELYFKNIKRLTILHLLRIIAAPFTEGALIASTNRGARAINLSGGCHAEVYGDSMSRAPVVALPTVKEAVALKKWIEDPEQLRMCEGKGNCSDIWVYVLFLLLVYVKETVYLGMCVFLLFTPF